MANSKRPLAAALGAAFLASSIAPLVSAEANPFSAQPLSGGYNLASYDKHAEGGCGGNKAEGEGSCGGAKAEGEGSGDGTKAAGEGKCGEGKCGGDKAAGEADTDATKADGEGKCGEGKCGAK
jgi:uncharacterized low-complexity protein